MMAACAICNLCDKPGSFEAAVDVGRVPCNVRQFQTELFTLWRCTNCNSLHSREDVDLAHYYRHYPLHQHRLDPATRITYGNRLRLLKKRGIRPTSRILDFGCGAGLFVQFLREQGYRHVSGYDEYAPGFSDAALLDRRYDAIVSYDVVEHVSEPREYFCSLVELLDIGGLLSVGTPNADHMSLKARTFSPEFHPPYHRHILSERALTGLADEAGFEVEHVHRRLYVDSLIPGLNTRFMWAYVDALGGVLDPLVEPPRTDVVFRSPQLMFYMLFGYFLPPKSNILISFRKARESRAC